jgi:hypothetical protein
MFSKGPENWPTARATRVPVKVTVLVISGLLSSCSQTANKTVVDSEQRTFILNCDKSATCTVAPATTNSVEPRTVERKKKGEETSAYALRASGRLVGVCGPLLSESSLQLADCRPLICQNDADCPPAEGLTRGVCINQLCTAPAHEFNSDDAVLLCLAGTGGPNQTALQAERFALGLNCGTPCRIPKVCRQP